MKLEHAIIYADAIIREAEAHGGEVCIDSVDLKALEMILSLARSEQMERRAGADQKAWEEKARSCYGCKYEHRGLFDSPCVNCEAGTYNLWEAKENG